MKIFQSLTEAIRQGFREYDRSADYIRVVQSINGRDQFALVVR